MGAQALKEVALSLRSKALQVATKSMPHGRRELWCMRQHPELLGVGLTAGILTVFSSGVLAQAVSRAVGL